MFKKKKTMIFGILHLEKVIKTGKTCRKHDDILDTIYV